MKKMNHFSRAPRVFLSAALVLSSTGMARAQEIPPLPPLRGDAASLTDTMRFIEDKVKGKVNYMIYYHNNGAETPDAIFRRSREVSAVIADASSCSIDFHSRSSDGGGYGNPSDDLVKDFSARSNLRQVREIVLEQMDEVMQREVAKTGRPVSVRVEPPITSVLVKISDKGGVSFLFYDQTVAERVARALRHAVSLCGGGKPETF